MRSAINPKIFPPLSLFPPRISKGRPASYPANVCHSKIAFNTAMTAARTQADTRHGTGPEVLFGRQPRPEVPFPGSTER